MNFDVVFLGTGAAVPTLQRGTTSQFVSIHGHHYLLDAGEGTQLMLKQHRLPFQKIRGIFISHMHGDHVLGLPGLFSTMSLLGRKAPLHVWGPPGLSDWLGATWKAISAHHTFPFQVTEWTGQESGILHEEERYRLLSFPVKHRVEACGIRIEEHGLKWKLKGDLVRQAKLPFDVRKQLQNGEGVDWEGQRLRPEDWAVAPRSPKSYVFSGDTRPCDSLKRVAHSATVLCHDATFLNRDSDKAKSTHHSTVKEAARLAAQAEVGRLILTHISSRYRDMDEFVKESGEFDIPVDLAHDGMKISL